MYTSPSRRIFLRNSAYALTGLAILTPSIATALVPLESPFLGYNPFAEYKTDLRTDFFNENWITVKGKIYNEDGSLPIDDATIEVWHLSPNSSKYRNRAKLKTGSDGTYKFITDFPNREAGKNARIYFKITNGGNTRFTELILNGTGPYITGAHWKDHYQLGEKLFPRKESFLNHSTIHFNISI